MCASEVWLANGWPGAESPDARELDYVLQSKGSLMGAEFKVRKGLGGGLWHLKRRLSGAQDPWDAAHPDPASAGIPRVQQVGNGRNPSNGARFSPGFHAGDEEPRAAELRRKLEQKNAINSCKAQPWLCTAPAVVGRPLRLFMESPVCREIHLPFPVDRWKPRSALSQGLPLPAHVSVTRRKG